MDFQFRDVFNKDLVEKLALAISRTWPEFRRCDFENQIISGLTERSYGARCELIADTLQAYLPESFPMAARILVDSLGPEPEAKELSGLDGFIIMPQCLFISRYGIEHPEVSLPALYEMTKRFTAEGDIRPFLRRYPEKTLEFLRQLSMDPSPFARRLASEGVRPRLPLGSRLPEFQKDPTPVLDLIERLKDDPNPMVRRSVANCLNDVSKDNPDIVVEKLQVWAQGADVTRLRLIRHALRTLFKSGHPGALGLMGYNSSARISVANLRTGSQSYRIGGDLEFSALITSGEEHPCRVMVDYVIGYQKAKGRISPKVFKGHDQELLPGQTIAFQKRHSLRQMSTRVHYPGRHTVAIQVNGVTHNEVPFQLTEAEQSGA